MSDIAQASVEHNGSAAAKPGGVWLIPALIVAGLIAGWLGEQIIVSNQTRFFTPEPGMPPWPEEYMRQARWDNMRNHAIGFGSLAAMLMAAIGLLVGATRSLTRALVGFIAGGVTGLVAGGVTGAVGYVTSDNLLKVMMEGLLKAILIFGPIWLVLCPLGALLAVLIAGQSRAVGRAFVVGLMAACIALVLYPLISVLVFPVGRPELIVPEHSGVRYTAYLVGSVATAIAAGIAIRPPREKQTTASRTPA